VPPRLPRPSRYPQTTFTSGGLERPGDRPTLAGTLTVHDTAAPGLAGRHLDVPLRIQAVRR
jgi:hypothetical protein